VQWTVLFPRACSQAVESVFASAETFSNTPPPDFFVDASTCL
jgi:hypothetical protein